MGHTLLVIVYHLLRDGDTYQDLGPQSFDLRDRGSLERRRCRRWEGRGYTLTLQPVA